MALGAGRARVVRQHLTAVLVLAAAGGVLGILFSVFGMRWFTQALSVNPPPFWITFELDYRAMLFVVGHATWPSQAWPPAESATISAC